MVEKRIASGGTQAAGHDQAVKETKAGSGVRVSARCESKRGKGLVLGDGCLVGPVNVGHVVNALDMAACTMLQQLIAGCNED